MYVLDYAMPKKAKHKLNRLLHGMYCSSLCRQTDQAALHRIATHSRVINAGHEVM